MSVTGTYQDFNLEMFNDDLQHDLQQKYSVLRGLVEVESVQGLATYFHKYGKMTGSVVKTQRNQDRNFDVASFERRHFDPKLIDHSHIIDVQDKLHMVKNYMPEAQAAIASNMGRELDKIIMDAIRGDAMVTADGTTSTVALPSSSKIAVNDHTFSATAGSNDICLTPAKIKNAIKRHGASHIRVDIEEIVVVSPMNQLMHLSTFDEVVNSDYRAKKPLETPGLYSGLDGYLGLRFIHYEPEEALVDANGNELVYVFVKKAVKLGMHKDLQSDIFKLHDIVGSPEAIASFFEAGAVRMWEEAVIEIACHPTNNIPT